MHLYRTKLLNKKECKFIKDYILTNEQRIKDMGPDNYDGTSDNSLTGRFELFNFLLTPCGSILIPKLRKVFEELGWEYPIAIQCWANTFRYDEGITKHQHGDSTHSDVFFCSNLFIGGATDIGTDYYLDKEWKKYNNKKGELTLFNHTTPHRVSKNPTNDVRVTMAMDLFVSKNININTWKEFEQSTDRYIILRDGE